MNEKYEETQDIVGKGEFACIVKGINKNNKEEVALKKISKKSIIMSSNADYIIKNMKKEVDNLQKCQCEATVKLYDYIENDSSYIIVMELCDESLRKNVDDRKDAFSTEEIYEIFSHLNKVFKIMNENNIVHRDLKLENILVKYTDKSKKKFIPKLCDFGFSKEIEFGQNTVLGTPYTMAPEVIKKEEYGPKADLWSLGVIIYYCHFKKLPYNNLNINQLLNENKLQYERPKNFFLADLIDKLLTIEKNERISWDEYLNHAFFKISKLTNFNIGFKNDYLNYYKALYKYNDNEYRNILIKEIKQDNNEENIYLNELDILEKFDKNKNVLKFKIQEFKGENNKKIIYLIYECDDNCVSLYEYLNNHAFEEKDIQKINEEFYEIFKKVSKKSIFISIYSFIVNNSNGELKLIDFSLNKKYLPEDKLKIYFAPNLAEMSKSEYPEKTLLMNYGITLLQMMNNNDNKIIFENNKFVLKSKQYMSEQLKSFLTKCLCQDVISRANWEDLERDIFGNKKDLLILNKNQFIFLLENLLNKYITINTYYNSINDNIDNIDNITENEIFILLNMNEINTVKKILSTQDGFNSSKNRMTFLTLSVNKEEGEGEGEGEGEDKHNKIIQKFVNIKSRNCFDMKLMDYSQYKDEISRFIEEISQIFENLKTIVSKIQKEEHAYDVDNILEKFINNYENLKFNNFFFSFIKNYTEKYKNKEILDKRKTLEELNICKYIAEFLLFFKQSVYETDINFFETKYKQKEELINDINEVFGKENKNNKKFILISFICEELKNILDNIDEDNIIVKDNKNALQELIYFYPNIIDIIKIVENN